jgi:hypothetical protein
MTTVMDHGATWDDEPTLVHGREAHMIAPIPPPLPARLSRVHRELEGDDLWLESLPAATRAVLEDARFPKTLEAPRLRFAVAQPV